MSFEGKKKKKEKKEGEGEGEEEGKEEEEEGGGRDASSTFLQTSFDLLGELLKFNFDVFGMFEELLSAAQVCCCWLLCCLFSLFLKFNSLPFSPKNNKTVRTIDEN